jgi:factor associated with neutral sphingomyelinase activation
VNKQLQSILARVLEGLVKSFILLLHITLLLVVMTGSVDLCAVIDPVTRLMYEIQILEFGQIPRQLFTKPHPARYAGLIPTPLSLMTSSDVQTGSQEEEDGAESRTRSWSQSRLCDLQIHTVFQGHKKSVTGLAFYSQSGDVQAVSVSLDGFLKAYK